MKYQRISAFYDETKLPQTFMGIGLYFSADKIAILATCRMKLCSITADSGWYCQCHVTKIALLRLHTKNTFQGPSIAEIQFSFIRET